MLSREKLLEEFFNKKEYKKVKDEVESQFFKMLGDYCKFDGEKIIKLPANKISEHFKNKKVTITVKQEKRNGDGTPFTEKTVYTKKFYEIWSEDPTIKTYDEIIFDCDEKKVKSNQFNLYRGLRVYDDKTLEKSKKASLSPIFEHIQSLVNYNDEHFTYLLNWLAQLVQQPHILPHTTLVFISKEGVGKDIFSNFISKAINENYTFNTEKLENICGKFNSMLGGKILCTVNETNPIESRERIENIKFLITADNVTIEGKHKDAIKAKNYCRFIFFSNRLMAFPVEEGSRRPVIFHSSDKYLKENIGAEENNKYFSKLVSLYNDDAYQCAFLQFLKNRDISKFNPKDFTKSELHKELEDNSISPIVHWLADVIKANIDKEKLRLSTVEALNNCTRFMKDNNYKYELSQTKFNTELTQLYNIKKIKSNGSMYFEFIVADIKEMLEKKYKYSFDKKDEEEKEEEDDDDKNDYYKKLCMEQQKELNLLRAFRNQYQELYDQFKQCFIIEDKPAIKNEESDEEDKTTDETTDDEDDNVEQDKTTDDEDDDDKLNLNQVSSVTNEDLEELDSVLDSLQL